MAEKQARPSIGGQALMEGIMMKGADSYAVAVRTPQGEIDIQVTKTKQHAWAKIPILRGVLTFFDSIITGYKCLMRSAEISMGDSFEESESKLDKWIEKHFGKQAMNIAMIIATVFAVIFAISLFMVLPTMITGAINYFVPLGNFKAVIEGVIKIIIFLSYMAIVSNIKDVYRMFCYHGAEHKTIACFEAGEELTVENIKKHTRFHPRCGTSFLFIVIIISILVFSFLPWYSTLIRAGLKLVLLPVVMGLSYEVIRYAGKHRNCFTKAISAPGIWLQRLTTNEPEDDMIQVAIASVKAILDENELPQTNAEQPQSINTTQE